MQRLCAIAVIALTALAWVLPAQAADTLDTNVSGLARYEREAPFSPLPGIEILPEPAERPELPGLTPAGQLNPAWVDLLSRGAVAPGAKGELPVRYEADLAVPEPWALLNQDEASSLPAWLTSPREVHPNVANDPAFSAQAQRTEDNPYSSFAAVQWDAGPLGLTLGGGYAREAATAASAGSGSGGRIMSADRRPGSSAAGDSLSRWSAYVAVPYQITGRFSLRPEFTYHYEEGPNELDANNEWVMGLQFGFGF